MDRTAARQRVSVALHDALGPWQRRALCAIVAVHPVGQTCAWCVAVPRQRSGDHDRAE